MSGSVVTAGIIKKTVKQIRAIPANIPANIFTHLLVLLTLSSTIGVAIAYPSSIGFITLVASSISCSL